MIKWLSWHPAMPGNMRRAAFLTILEPANAREVASDAAAEMRHLNLYCGKLIEKTAIDQPHCRHHQRKFPAEHAPEVVRIHVRPAHEARRGMDEDVELEVGCRLPKGS